MRQEAPPPDQVDSQRSARRQRPGTIFWIVVAGVLPALLLVGLVRNGLWTRPESQTIPYSVLMKYVVEDKIVGPLTISDVTITGQYESGNGDVVPFTTILSANLDPTQLTAFLQEKGIKVKTG